MTKGRDILLHNAQNKCCLKDCQRWQSHAEFGVADLMPKEEHSESAAECAPAQGYCKEHSLGDAPYLFLSCRAMFIDGEKDKAGDIRRCKEYDDHPQVFGKES